MYRTVPSSSPKCFLQISSSLEGLPISHHFIASFLHPHHFYTWSLQTAIYTKKRYDVMGQPSSQASNAIIYLTYSIFLYGFPISSRRFSFVLIQVMAQLQVHRTLHCLALEKAVKIGVSIVQSHSKGLDIVGSPLGSGRAPILILCLLHIHSLSTYQKLRI